MATKSTKKTDDQINAIVKRAITSAKNHVSGDIETERLKAMRYFKGETDLSFEEDRSKVVDTKCRDAVRAVEPVLMRIFLQSEKPAEFIPKGPEDVAGAEQATDYASWKFNQSGGFQLLSSVFRDALVSKTGIAKVYWDESETVEIDEYSNLTIEEAQMHLQGEGIEVLEHSPVEGMMDTPQGPMPITLHDMKISRTNKSGELKIKTVPPEHFFTDSGATGMDDFYIMGHSEEVRVTDLVEMGYNFEEVAELGAEGEEEAEYERVEDLGDDEGAGDPSMKPVTLTEAYMRMDIEGTGVARLYKFICGGADHKVLDYELADDVPFAVFEVDPVAHAFFGQSLVDLIIEDQDVGTSLRRGLIDGIHMSNNPRTFYKEGEVDVEALLNNEYGALVACKNPQTDVIEAASPNTATASLPAITYFDQSVDAKTGSSKAGMGMDGDALQSQTVVGANAMVQSAQATVELMARHLAEGGYKRLFKLMFKAIRKHVPPGEHMRLSGQFVPVDPSGWNAEMDVTTNVGLGTGQKAERYAALQAQQVFQQTIWGQYGPQNGLITLSQIRNTQADILALGGIHNADRHMNPMSPEAEAQLMQQQAQAAQGQEQGSDPNAAFLQAEQMKVQQKAQSDEQKNILSAQRAAMDDDFRRDKMAQDLFISAAQQAQQPVPVQQVQYQQQQPRQPQF